MKGAELRDLRKKMGLTQKGLAKELHIGLSTLQTWESDIRPISHANEKLIKELYQTSMLSNDILINEKSQGMVFKNYKEFEVYLVENWEDVRNISMVQKLIELECKKAINEFLSSSQFKSIIENIISAKHLESSN